jgi:hypothetical protein
MLYSAIKTNAVIWIRRNVQVRAPDGGPYSSTRTKNKDDDYRYLVKALLD